LERLLVLNSSVRPSAALERYSLAIRRASANETTSAVHRVGKRRTFARSGIVMTILQKIQAARKVPGDVARLSLQESVESVVGCSHSSPYNVPLVLAGKLATSDEQEGSRLRRGIVSRPHAEAKEP